MCYACSFALDDHWLCALQTQVHVHAGGKGERKCLANVLMLIGRIVPRQVGRSKSDRHRTEEINDRFVNGSF